MQLVESDKATSVAIVFTDIAGVESASLKQFYPELFDCEISQKGSFSTSRVSLTKPPTLMGNRMGLIEMLAGKVIVS